MSRTYPCTGCEWADCSCDPKNDKCNIGLDTFTLQCEEYDHTCAYLTCAQCKTMDCPHNRIGHDDYGVVTCFDCGYQGNELEEKLLRESYEAFNHCPVCGYPNMIGDTFCKECTVGFGKEHSIEHDCINGSIPCIYEECIHFEYCTSEYKHVR